LAARIEFEATEKTGIETSARATFADINCFGRVTLALDQEDELLQLALAPIITIRKVSYDAKTDTVELTPTRPFGVFVSVQLTVDGNPPGGLHDEFGRLIDGAGNGQPGGNAVAIFRRGAVTLNPVPATARPRAAALHAAVERVPAAAKVAGVRNPSVWKHSR
jgi:hypothetical protein